MAHTGIGGTDEGGTGLRSEKTGEKAELTSTEEKQKLEAEANSMKRFNKRESASSDLSSDFTPEEQSEKPRKLDKIAEYKRMGASHRETATYMGLSASTVCH